MDGIRDVKVWVCHNYKNLLIELPCPSLIFKGEWHKKDDPFNPQLDKENPDLRQPKKCCDAWKWKEHTHKQSSIFGVNFLKCIN
jgi:hypothetical protein